MFVIYYNVKFISGRKLLPDCVYTVSQKNWATFIFTVL